MKSTQLKALIEKLNNHLVQCLDAATGKGLSQNHYEITMEHLLGSLLDNGQGDVPLILRNFGVDAGSVQEICNKNLQEMEKGNPGKPRLSPMLSSLLEEAWIISSVHHEEQKIRSGALFEAFIASEWVISTGLMDILEPVKQEELRTAFHNIMSGSLENSKTSTEMLPAETIKEIPAGETVLALYTVNLTAQAKEGKIDPILGRDDEIIQMTEILSRRKKSNPILLGEPGVGKTAVVEGLALKIAKNEVPESLRNVQIHSLDMGSLQAGTKMRGEFEKRLKAVITEVINSGKSIILFIDEAHTLIGAGGSAGQGDAANMLKPALARGELRAIAATTYLEYNKYFAKDAALERRFQPIHVGEPEDPKAILMLRGIKEKYEKYHGIHISDKAIEAAVKLSRRYIPGRQLPDKAVDLLDTAATRIKMSLTSMPPSLELLKSRRNSVDIHIQSIQRDSDLEIHDHSIAIKELETERSELDTSIQSQSERWQKETALAKSLMDLRKQKLPGEGQKKNPKIDEQIKEAAQQLEALQGDSPLVFTNVTELTVAQVIESWTGIQAGDMTRDEMTTLMQLETELKARVMGQDHAIKQIADVIRSAKIGLKKEDSPIGVFMLIGTSGVGKTELARAVAEALFGDERFLITLNMTEYQNDYNTSRLIGADPGLVGYGEGGSLSEPVRRRPYSVVLLDEIEKANSSVVDLFMQVFDRGMLQDADRRQIDFTNTLIFMTSNLASDVLFDRFNNGITDPDVLLEEMRPYMNKFFRPEFLGRLKPVVFLPLTGDIMSQIVQLKLKKLVKRLAQNQNVVATFSDAVVDHIVQCCTRTETGARNIDAILDRRIAPEIAMKLLGFMADGKQVTTLLVDKDGDDSYKYEFA